MIKIYINAHLAHPKFKNKPLIFFSENDLETAKDILIDLDIDFFVKSEKDILVRCKHFPYTCKEVEEEHSTNEMSYRTCSCTGDKYCRESVPDYRSYIPFEWNSEFMKHKDNCYDDCCCISEIFNRYVVSIN